jgi:hypothetical protein
MHRLTHTSPYIQPAGIVIAGVILGVVFDFKGIRVVIGTAVLALPIILALDVLWRAAKRK